MKKCNGIKNIILDVGNVLVDFRYMEYMKDLGFSDELAAEVSDKVVINPLWNEYDRGIMPEEEFIGLMKQKFPGREEVVQCFFDNIDGIVEEYDYTVEWINAMKEAGYKVYILSNYPESLWKMHEKSRFTFLSKVDGKIVSGFVKLIKPDEAIYRMLLDTYGLKADECLFFDDRINNIEAAKKVGMRAVLFTDYETHRKMLDEGLY